VLEHSVVKERISQRMTCETVRTGQLSVVSRDLAAASRENQLLRQKKGSTRQGGQGTGLSAREFHGGGYGEIVFASFPLGPPVVR
jgi:hypothetical protein